MANWGNCVMCGASLVGRRADALTCSENCRKAKLRYQQKVTREIRLMAAIVADFSRHACLLSASDFDSLDALNAELRSLFLYKRDSRRVPHKNTKRDTAAGTLSVLPFRAGGEHV